MQAQILVPLDASALSEGVLPQAEAVAWATGRGLTLVRVNPSPIIVESVLGMALLSDQVAERQAADLDLGTSY